MQGSGRCWSALCLLPRTVLSCYACVVTTQEQPRWASACVFRPPVLAMDGICELCACRIVLDSRTPGTTAEFFETDLLGFYQHAVLLVSGCHLDHKQASVWPVNGSHSLYSHMCACKPQTRFTATRTAVTFDMYRKAAVIPL